MHSYIISGDGDAARSRAREMAAAALCESSGAKPCRACRHCRKVFQGAFPGIHPDVALVERAADKSGKLRREITVDQIRALAVDAAVLPNEADGKVYIFPEADTMNIAAQNAFLKLLEEPPPNWMFILVASRLERLLPTILSRVIQLRFDQIPLALTQEALNRLGLERPELLARLAGGSLGAAVNLAAADAVSYRDQALEFLEALPLAQPMRYVASQPWLESYDKQGGLLFTEMLLFLARDVLLWQNGLEEQIYNCDCTDRLRRLAASWPASHLKQAADIAQQAYQAIESNAGAKLVLETVVLKTDILRKEER